MAYSWWSGIKGPKIDPTKGGGAQFGFGSQGYGGGNGYGGGQERQKPVPPSFYDYDYSGVPMGEDAAQRLSQRYWSGLAGLGDFFSSYTAPRYMASVEGLMGMLTPEAAQARARERWDSSRSMRAQQASQARQTALLSGLSPEAAAGAGLAATGAQREAYSRYLAGADPLQAAMQQYQLLGGEAERAAGFSPRAYQAQPTPDEPTFLDQVLGIASVLPWGNIFK